MKHFFEHWENKCGLSVRLPTVCVWSWTWATLVHLSMGSTICRPLGVGLIARGNFSESWAEMKGMGDKILVWWTENAFSKCLLLSNVSPFATWVHLWLFRAQGNQTIIWFSISQRKCMQYHALQTFWHLVINQNWLWFEANGSRIFQRHFIYSPIKIYIIRGFKSLSNELRTMQADQKDKERQIWSNHRIKRPTCDWLNSRGV